VSSADLLCAADHICTVEHGFERPPAIRADPWTGVTDFRMHGAGVHGPVRDGLRVRMQAGLCPDAGVGVNRMHARAKVRVQTILGSACDTRLICVKVTLELASVARSPTAPAARVPTQPI
jgi:hypothetical protein